MPTNILRDRAKSVPKGAGSTRALGGARRAVITAGKVAIRIELLDTQTAALLWAALPLYSVAETWGECIHIETPIETGRERTTRLNGIAGEIYYWSEERRILIGFGPTPISRPNEIRLPRPCNIWARALDDVRLLASVTPGEKASITAARD